MKPKQALREHSNFHTEPEQTQAGDLNMRHYHDAAEPTTAAA